MMVMVPPGNLRISITPKLSITCGLIGIEQGAGFEVRRQMHRAQTTLQLGNRRRRSAEAIQSDFAPSKELVEGLFLHDQLAAERLGRRAHTIKDRLYVAALARRLVGVVALYRQRASGRDSRLARQLLPPPCPHPAAARRDRHRRVP